MGREMKLTKQDLMRLPKERLAELLVEMQDIPTITTPEPTPMPTLPYNPYPYPWWNPPVITYTTNDIETGKEK